MLSVWLLVRWCCSTLSDELLRFLLSRVTSMSALPSATAGAAVATAVRQQWTKVGGQDHSLPRHPPTRRVREAERVVGGCRVQVKEGLEAAVDNPHLSKAVAGSITGALGGIGGLSSQEQEGTDGRISCY